MILKALGGFVDSFKGYEFRDLEYWKTEYIIKA